VEPAVADVSRRVREAPVEVIEHWVRTAARAASSKTDDETVVLEVGEVLSITTWFVITSGRNPRQVKALVEEIEEQIDLAGGPKPISIEGLDALEWVLMDYGDFVVHVFVESARRFYELERLWSDVPRLDWQGPTATVSVPQAPSGG
jgi:ribosome-associated protein